MKNILNPTRVMVILGALASPCTLAAQSPCPGVVNDNAPPARGTDIPDVTANGTQDKSTLTPASFGPAALVPALNGTGLLAIDPDYTPLFSYGYDAAAGWDSSNVDGSSALFTASPYLGVQSSFGHTQFLLQYAPTFTKYTASNYVGGNLERASARFLGTIGPRWQWNAGSTFAYGQDSLRLLAPPESIAIGDVPGLDPNAAVYRPNAGVGTFVNTDVGVSYLRSERDSINLQLGDSYSQLSDVPGDSSTMSARMNYTRRLSPTLSLSPYGQILASTGSVSCASIGGGAGIAWQLAERTGLSLSAGPQFSSKACGSQQSYVYNAAFNTRLNASSQMYALAGRQFSSPYLGPGLWQNTIATGYQRMFRTTTVASLDVSYASSPGVGTATDYHGVFLGGSLGRTLGRALNPSLTYRRIMSHAGTSRLDRDTLMFSLNWNSRSFPIFN